MPFTYLQVSRITIDHHASAKEDKDHQLQKRRTHYVFYITDQASFEKVAMNKAAKPIDSTKRLSRRSLTSQHPRNHEHPKPHPSTTQYLSGFTANHYQACLKFIHH
ncbi:hypothetical protein F53441_4528 [Fusarium austroafricanum]|uniref:Uncharacterized protein n=1 Tax=Fusarium austroafricanum TaxID=2364996 RepID=A0A8H4KM64_9HYPO|nr:hypothetical protein F53441_4528 [Fusarium austroafricanum]